MSVAFTEIAWRGQPVRIEHQWINRDRHDAPLMVFLHEGLGSLAMWKDFPQRLCTALGCRGLVYSRPGYGRSTPRAPEEVWDQHYMHRQAYEILPALLRALQIDANADKPWLFGHSDGGSIALLYAAQHTDQVAAAVVVAPHILVEDISVRSITQSRQAYLDTDMRERLGRYHDDPDSAFWGWNQIWLLPQFRDWSIEQDISTITCPLLAVQGVDDEHGTMEQIHGIARRLPQTRLLELAQCRHSPHKDQSDKLIAAVHDFFQAHANGHRLP